MSNEAPFSDSDFDDIDHDVERLLRDAYEAPPVPASLLRRLDRQVAQEWGHSPGLLVRTPSVLQKTLAFGKRWVRTVPLAACSVVLVIGLLMFGRGSSAYGWSSMVRALEQQGLVQLDRPGIHRWLSLADGVLCERSATSQFCVDVRQQVVLERGRNEQLVRRGAPPGGWTTDNRDRLVLAFLQGQINSNATLKQLQNARLVSQSSARVQRDGHEAVALTVRWEVAATAPIDLRLLLDPVTKLPQSCEVLDSKLTAESSSQLSYPASKIAAVREREFRVALAAVDTDDQVSLDATDVPMPNRTTTAKPDNLNADQSNDRDKPAPESLVRLADASQWGPVAYVSASQSETVQRINRVLDQLWQTKGVEPAPAADDTELLRRIYLDLCGRTPSVHEIRSYLSDKSPDRYETLVSRLLSTRDHASHLATVWRTFLIPEGVDLTAFGGVEAFDRWMADRFANHDSYDSIVRSLLLAEGRLARSGPLLFYSAVKLDPDQLASRTARVFLGIRLECAQCHDHPFEPWKQQDFWGMAAFFAQISRPRGELQAASTVMQVLDVDHGEVKLPNSDTVISPRYLNQISELASLETKAGSPSESRRTRLAKWVTAADNPYFCRATANRVWSILFGRGIVDPVDDFGVRHQPKSAELLDLVAGRLASTDFDLRDLFQTIAMTRAYRLSSAALTSDSQRTELFAQMNVKTFTAEQVYDCMIVATMLDNKSNANADPLNLARYGNSEREQFLLQFRTPAGRATEYQGGIPQALTLMNGALISQATDLARGGLLKSLEAPFFTNRERIDVLYLATLSRHPREAEWELLQPYISNQTSLAELRENLSDILWALLNSAEFTMNH